MVAGVLGWTGVSCTPHLGSAPRARRQRHASAFNQPNRFPVWPARAPDALLETRWRHTEPSGVKQDAANISVEMRPGLD